MCELNVFSQLRRFIPVLIAIIALASSNMLVAADSFAGKFLGPDTTVTVEQAKAVGAYSGEIQLHKQKFPYVASVKSDTLTGQFRYKDSFFDFSARVVGDVMTFKTATKTIILKRDKPKLANPFIKTAPKTPAKTKNPFGAGTANTKVAAAPAPTVHPLIGQWTDGSRIVQISGDLMTVVDKSAPKVKQTGKVLINGDRITVVVKDQIVTLSYQIKNNVLTLVDTTGFKETYTRIGKGPTGTSTVSIEKPAANSAAQTLQKLAPEKDFVGTFTGEFRKRRATIKLDLIGNDLSGRITSKSRIFKVEGKVNGTTAQLVVIDLITGAEVPFRATMSDGKLKFNWALKDLTNGRAIELLPPMYFVRQTASDKRNSQKK